jgi:hypothetical protein
MNLVRLYRDSDLTCSQALSIRGLGAKSKEYGLRIGHHHRSVSESFRLGPVWESKGSRQDVQLAGPQGSIPTFNRIIG